MKEEKLKKEIQKILSKKEIDYQKFLELSAELSKFDDENLRFQADAGTIAHLGKDSIKDHTTAILELVKNSYDADANRVEINIHSSDVAGESYIRITDDGTGMSKSDIISKWLRIGYSEKRTIKKTKSNRRKTGEKGIGRISADRLGKKLILKSKKAGEEPFGFEINWTSFEKQGINLSLIPFQKVDASDLDFLENNNQTGTDLFIYELRDPWTDSDLTRLDEELSILVSPFQEDSDFCIVINNNISSDRNGIIKSPHHIDPEVQIDVFFDGIKDEISYTINDKYGLGFKTEKTISWSEMIGSSGLLKDVKKFDVSNSIPKCGPVMFSLMFYLRNAASLNGTGFNLNQLKEYLKYNGGVKIYRDQISVKPYGFSGKDGEDWLNLGQRQGQNPAGLRRASWMVKNNQVLGAVYIGRDENENLKDSAAREGLVHNRAYYDLRGLVLCGMRLLETHRHQIQLKLDAENPKPARPNAKHLLELYQTNLLAVQSELEAIREENNTEGIKERIERSSAMITTAIEYTESAEKEIKALLNKNRTLSGLATLGISSAVFGHETALSISQIRNSIYEARQSLNETPPDIEEAINELAESENYAKYVGEWGAFALSRVKRDKREQKKTDISELFTTLINDITPTFDGREISIDTNFDEVISKTFPMDLETILVNLLTNSYAACMHSSRNRQILVELKLESKDDRNGFTMSVSDSGPGVNDTFKSIIWEPLFTTKSGSKKNDSGTGLGLSIVKSIVEDLGGTKKVGESELLKGARFDIWFPLKK